jgi:hypothetical protein
MPPTIFALDYFSDVTGADLGLYSPTYVSGVEGMYHHAYLTLFCLFCFWLFLPVLQGW